MKRVTAESLLSAQQSSTYYDLLGKVLLVGNSSVGKSSLLYRLTENSFSDSLAVTIGVEFGTAYFSTKNDSRNTVVKAQIWDCAGQYKFQNIVNSYFHQADIIIFVFDLTVGQSYVDLKGWVDRADKALNGRPHIKKIIGNKLDLASSGNGGDDDASNRAIETDVAKLYAQSIGAGYIEMSAKDSAEPFEKLLGECLSDAYCRFVAGEPLLHKSVYTKRTVTPKIVIPLDVTPEESNERKCCF